MGAYVSGRNSGTIMAHAPANIIMTQYTHLQDTPLAMMLDISTLSFLSVTSRDIVNLQSTDYEAHRRSQEDCCAEQARCKSTIINGKDVSNDTSAANQRGDGEETREKARYEKCLDILRERLPENEQGVQRHRACKDRPPADEFAAGAPEKWLVEIRT